MFYKRNIITGIELGTSKFCVLIGEVDRNGELSVIGHGEAPSEGCVRKGEIVDMDAAFEILSDILDEADRASGAEIDPDNIFIAVTGSEMDCCQGVGSLLIKNEDSMVTEEDISNARDNASVKQLPPGKIPVMIFDSYYTLDEHRQVNNPLGLVANKLEARVHIIYGDNNRIKNFQAILAEVGYEEDYAKLVFSPLAAACGVMTRADKENGCLLVEMGQGITEYILIHNDGVLYSGVMPVGLDHVANDLSIALDLHISQCRKFISEEKYIEARNTSRAFIKIPSAAPGAARKIPVNSIDKTIDLRLRETFEIIKARLEKRGLLHYISRGGILTGGAALFEPASEIFENVFEFPVRIGRPGDVKGVITGLDTPRYSTVWGILKYGKWIIDIQSEQDRNSFWGGLMRGVDNISLPIIRGFSTLKDSIKF
jgi:cell division protein FtsA